MLGRVVKILLFCIIIALITGYIYKNEGDKNTGDRIIGLAVIALTFIVMPLFLIHRRKKLNVHRYRFPGKEEKDEGKFS